MIQGDTSSFRHALRIALTYLVLGTAWIYVSDALVETIADAPRNVTLLQTYKGIFFVVLTTFLLFLLSYRLFRSQFFQYLRNLEERTKARDDLDRLAHVDSLTTLPNRLSLNKHLEKRCGGSERFAFLFLDLDGFQTINDSYGHRFGDALLARTAGFLRDLFPDRAYIARTGGDEFGIILSCPGSTEEIVALMERLRFVLDHPVHIEGIDVYVTASVGIALFPDDAARPEELFQNADAAMYSAKKQGKNTYRFYTADLTKQALYRTSVATSLKQALQQNALVLYYQPQVNARDETFVGMEGLLRWFTPRGPLNPAVFIPIAEESGLIVQVGEFVLASGCAAAARWSALGLLVGRVALNISVRQLIHPDFIPMLERIAESAGCRPEWIELEITESSILDTPHHTIELLHTLKNRGFAISIDDFGTGYSSLSYLKHLPADKLKIDQSFIRDLPNEPKNQSIVKAIIALAEGLGMEVLAEGVETAEELGFLRDHGLYAVQGYYYHRPVDEKALEALLRG